MCKIPGGVMVFENFFQAICRSFQASLPGTARQTPGMSSKSWPPRIRDSDVLCGDVEMWRCGRFSGQK